MSDPAAPGAAASGAEPDAAGPAPEPRAPFPWIAWSPLRITAAVGYVVVAVAIAVVAIGPAPELPAYLVLALATGPLALVDAVAHRLPNPLVLAALVGVAAGLGGAALVIPNPGAALDALLGGAAMCALYLVLAIASRGGVGMGDVKLAAPLGVALGWLGWTTWFWGLTGGFVAGAIVALVALATRRAGLRSRIPFGPAMLAGAWGAVLVSGALLP